MQPSEVAALLRHSAFWWRRGCRSDFPNPGAEVIEALADSFDQPGDGPLAYSESEGRMVRRERLDVENLRSCLAEAAVIVHNEARNGGETRLANMLIDWAVTLGHASLWRFPGALEADQPRPVSEETQPR